jgi:glycosyltransferase involved in cell wall biosynthesis
MNSQTSKLTPSFSVLILTYNEEMNLPGCLESIGWCDDIVVLDSYSSDSTVALAEAHASVRVFQRKFDDFAGQRNFAIDTVEFKYDWVFHLDADEHFTPALVEECRQQMACDAQSGYQVPSKMMLWGRWLKHAGVYPVYQMRFHKLGEVRFEQYGHGQREGESKRGIGFLQEPYEHHSFGKGLAEWFDRHNRYSSNEAQETVARLAENKLKVGDCFAGDKIVRRRALKELSFRLPCRPLFRFVYQYFIKLGFLDGRPGFAYSMMLALYESQISLKVMELKVTEKMGDRK